MHCISFSPNGKLLAAISLMDNVVSVWQPHGGIMSSIAGAFAMVNQDTKPFRSFQVGTKSNLEIKPENVTAKFEWPQERTLKYKHDSIELVFNI